MTTNMNIGARTPEYIDHAILRVEDSAESLKHLTDSIFESSKMLSADINNIKGFLFNSPPDPNKREIKEPMCLADSLRQILEVIDSCRSDCGYIQERF